MNLLEALKKLDDLKGEVIREIKLSCKLVDLIREYVDDHRTAEENGEKPFMTYADLEKRMGELLK